MKGKIYQVAKEAGVSTATVSRVFNGRPYVREALRKKVLETTQRLNYVPKLTARKVNIAILVEGLKSLRLGTYENILLAFLTEYIIGNRYTFEIITVSELELIRHNFLDVIIAISYNPVTTEKIKIIKGPPILSINNPIPGSHHICSDHKQGIELAVDYFVTRGHKKIGFFQRNEESWGSKERIIGYKEAIKKQGLLYQENLVEIAENSTSLGAIVKICRYQPTALIISGENASLEIVHALNLLHKKTPQDISVISFENDSVSPYLNPPHTTISQGLEEISKTTVKKARDIIEGKVITPVEVVIKNTLIERDSVRTLKSEPT